MCKIVETELYSEHKKIIFSQNNIGNGWLH